MLPFSLLVLHFLSLHKGPGLFWIQFAASQYFPLRFAFFCLRNPTALRNVAELRTKWGDDSVGNVLAAGLRIWVRIPRTHVESWMLWLTLVILVMSRREEETRKSLDACCELLWSTLWGSRPVSNTVANRRCEVPEECNLRLFSNLHMYTQAHSCTDTHTENMYIHMRANAQAHQFQNETWVKIVKNKKNKKNKYYEISSATQWKLLCPLPERGDAAAHSLPKSVLG